MLRPGRPDYLHLKLMIIVPGHSAGHFGQGSATAKFSRRSSPRRSGLPGWGGRIPSTPMKPIAFPSSASRLGRFPGRNGCFGCRSRDRSVGWFRGAQGTPEGASTTTTTMTENDRSRSLIHRPSPKPGERDPHVQGRRSPILRRSSTSDPSSSPPRHPARPPRPARRSGRVEGRGTGADVLASLRPTAALTIGRRSGSPGWRLGCGTDPLDAGAAKFGPWVSQDSANVASPQHDFPEPDTPRRDMG